jgi:hypothetical protein
LAPGSDALPIFLLWTLSLWRELGVDLSNAGFNAAQAVLLGSVENGQKISIVGGSPEKLLTVLSCLNFTGALC